jgi:hypothetical protein
MMKALFHGDERGPLYRIRPLLNYPLHSHTRPALVNSRISPVSPLFWLLHLSLSRFAAGTHVGAAHRESGAPPASTADRAGQEQCQTLSLRQRPHPPVASRRRRSGHGTLLCPAQPPGALDSVAANDLIGINSTDKCRVARPRVHRSSHARL